MGSEPAVIPAGGGEVVGDAPDRRVEILCEHDALHATWSRFGPGRDGADLHVHHRHTDLFYVLAGELTLRLGPEGEEHRLPPGTLARMPPLVIHGFRNGADAEVRYLNLHAPGRGFAGYLRALRDRRDAAYDQFPPPADGGRSPADAVIGARREGVLADVEEIGISEVRAEPGEPVPAPHVHPRHLESFYVLEAAMTFVLDGREHRAETGAWVTVPPGVAHTWAVAGSAPARFLDLHTPGFGLGAADQEPAQE